MEEQGIGGNGSSEKSGRQSNDLKHEKWLRLPVILATLFPEYLIMRYL